MIFDENFAHFYDFSTNFCQLADFLPRGGPRCFVKYSPVQRYQGTKGAKDTWVKSSEGLLGGRVFSGTHFRYSLSPEEGPSCYHYHHQQFCAVLLVNEAILKLI